MLGILRLDRSGNKVMTFAGVPYPMFPLNIKSSIWQSEAFPFFFFPPWVVPQRREGLTYLGSLSAWDSWRAPWSYVTLEEMGVRIQTVHLCVQQVFERVAGLLTLRAMELYFPGSPAPPSSPVLLFSPGPLAWQLPQKF